MKTIQRVTQITLLIFIFNGCSEVNQPSPTQNKTLHHISPLSTQKKQTGYLQENLDSWLEKDWEKKTQGFTQTKEANATGLQYYIEKAAYYFQSDEKTPASIK